jgi:6-phosphogluconolactonase (cycloisomerase 2 family)
MTDAQPLVMKTNNAEALRIDASQNVGIGTITPTTKLTVQGNELIKGEDNPIARGTSSTNLDGPQSVYVSGKYAYVASGNNNTLAIFDVSDPMNIVAKGYTSTNLNNPVSMYVSGKYAYVTSWYSSTLAIFDVSDPNAIVAKGFTNTNLSGPQSVYVSGKYAYVASHDNSRLAIFDVSDPNTIVAKGYTGTNLNGPYSVYVSGKYAYVAFYDNDRLAIFEVNNLETPTLATGNLASGGLDVTDNAIIGDNLYVQGGLNVGPGGTLLDGETTANSLTVGVGGLKVGITGTTLSLVQSGEATLGGGSAGVNVYTIVFTSTFSAAPNVLVTLHGENYNDVFAVTTRNITTSQFQVNVYRVDVPGGSWLQNLKLDWIAWVQQ